MEVFITLQERLNQEMFSPNVVFFANEDIRALYQRLKDKSCHVLRPLFPGEFESDRFIMIAVNFPIPQFFSTVADYCKD